MIDARVHLTEDISSDLENLFIKTFLYRGEKKWAPMLFRLRLKWKHISENKREIFRFAYNELSSERKRIPFWHRERRWGSSHVVCAARRVTMYFEREGKILLSEEVNFTANWGLGDLMNLNIVLSNLLSSNQNQPYISETIHRWQFRHWEYPHESVPNFWPHENDRHLQVATFSQLTGVVYTIEVYYTDIRFNAYI